MARSRDSSKIGEGASNMELRRSARIRSGVPTDISEQQIPADVEATPYATAQCNSSCDALNEFVNDIPLSNTEVNSLFQDEAKTEEFVDSAVLSAMKFVSSAISPKMREKDSQDENQHLEDINLGDASGIQNVEANHASLSRSVGGKVGPQGTAVTNINVKSSHPSSALVEFGSKVGTIAGAENLLSIQNVDSSIAQAMQNVKGRHASSSGPAHVEFEVKDAGGVRSTLKNKLRNSSKKNSFDNIPTITIKFSGKRSAEKLDVPQTRTSKRRNTDKGKSIIVSPACEESFENNVVQQSKTSKKANTGKARRKSTTTAVM